MEIYDLFNEVVIPEGSTAEFPIRSKYPEIDYVRVCMTLKREQVKPATLQCLLAAADQRNIIVYDEQSKDEVTGRLLWLLYMVHKEEEQASSITDIFISDKVKLSPNVHTYTYILGITVNTIDMQEAESYYVNALHGTFPSNYKNLVIAANAQTKSFVVPYQKSNYGVAVLDSKQVLLGAY